MCGSTAQGAVRNSRLYFMRTRSAFPPPAGDFTTILAALDEGEARDILRPVAGVGRLWTGRSDQGFGAAAIANAYAEHQPAPPALTRRIPDFGEVAAAIASARGADDLNRLRRALAFAAHPDRVPVESRAEAEGLMARVNAAIDDALART